MRNKITKGKVVEIVITEGHNYVKSVKNGGCFTSVDYWGGTYGGCSPCDNQEEINQTIDRMKESIIKEGDKPKVVDKRVKATLSGWL